MGLCHRFSTIYHLPRHKSYIQFDFKSDAFLCCVKTVYNGKPISPATVTICTSGEGVSPWTWGRGTWSYWPETGSSTFLWIFRNLNCHFYNMLQNACDTFMTREFSLLFQYYNASQEVLSACVCLCARFSKNQFFVVDYKFLCIYGNILWRWSLTYSSTVWSLNPFSHGVGHIGPTLFWRQIA